MQGKGRFLPALALVLAGCGGFFTPEALPAAKGLGTEPGAGAYSPAVVIAPALFASPGDPWGDVLGSLASLEEPEVFIDLAPLRDDLALMLAACGYDESTGKFEDPPLGRGFIKGIPFCGVNPYVYEAGGQKRADRYWGNAWPDYAALNQAGRLQAWTDYQEERAAAYAAFSGAGLPALPPASPGAAELGLYGGSTGGIRLILAWYEREYPSGWAAGNCAAALPAIENSLALLEALARQFYRGAWPGDPGGAPIPLSLPAGSDLGPLG
ncbi:MAG: hypothetical protein LBQ35_09605 [Spirochaetaceae bacterium]|jgi:hypothetical protein|nr:hypothetical protein [Spirochaetaceae bacterium]